MGRLNSLRPIGLRHFLRCRIRLRIRRFLRPTLRRPLPRRRLAILSPLAAPRFTESARNETGNAVRLERKCRFYPQIGLWLKV